MAGIHKPSTSHQKKKFIDDIVFSDDKEEREKYIDRNTMSVNEIPTGLKRFLRRQNKSAKIQLGV